MGNELLKKAFELYPKMQDYRRYLHQNAEVGFALEKTKGFVEDCLTKLGYQPKPCGRCGITADISAKRKGIFLLRADMDALPIQEKTGEAFACRLGNMHACGHDMHVAMLLGAAEILGAYAPSLKKGVRLLFQPAEELLEGAQDCIDAGVLQGVDGAMMLHVLPNLPFPCGTAVVSAEGISAPAADFFKITVSGKGCHGSSPWQGVDALLIAAKIVDDVQTIASREVSPQSPSVLTIGKMVAGDSGNVIAKKAVLSGSLRAMDGEVHAFLKERMEKIAQGTAKAFRGTAKVKYEGGCPCLVNDRKLSDFVHEVCMDTLGKKRCLKSSDFPRGGLGGSEDFAYISQKVPSIMVGICAGERGQVRDEALHSPRVQFDETALPYGAALLAAVALRRSL